MKPYTGGIDLPTDLTRWDEDLVAQLASRDGEPEAYDFKGAELFHAKAPEAGGLSELVCAYANTRGGFIIIGVSDKIPRQVTGIEPTGDVHQWFSRRLNVEPSPEYEGPHEIPLRSGRLLLVVYVPPSRSGPHWTPRDASPFKKRLAGANGRMTWSEVRDGFLHGQGLADKVQLLSNEYAVCFGIIHGYQYMRDALIGGRLKTDIMPERMPVEPIRRLGEELVELFRGEAGIGPQAREAWRGALRRLEAFNQRYDHVLQVAAAQGPIARKWNELVSDAASLVPVLNTANATLFVAAGLAPLTPWKL